MRIGGLQKLTLLDYPGKVACTVFLSGCNLRCPYCHNPGLVLPEQSEGSEIPEAEVLSFLERRKGKLDGVCITGGEPTLQPELPEFLEKLRRLGYAVKLDTNGTNPAMLKALLMSLDFYNILNMKEEKIVDHSAATALHAAMYIEEASSHFLEVGKLAKKFGLSRNRFTKVFTDYWQISPQEYLINYRISHAKNLLVNTAQTIGEIAARLGYSDHYFFARQFKAKTGFSPGVFRKERSKEINSD